MLAATLTLALIGLTLGLMLSLAHRRWPPNESELVQAIDARLPQTQCAQCGYPGCLPYARAIANGEAINKCPPGGDETINALARLLGREALPLDGSLKPAPNQVAVIDESRCIGCARCLPACPVDAIVGAPRQMHTVIEAQCTGCELCLPPCPVDCIELVPTTQLSEAWTWPKP